MIWELSYKADPRAREVADRHYNRQKPGDTSICATGPRPCALHGDGDREGVLGNVLPIRSICAPRMGGRVGMLGL